jgi:hypothetical protein
MRAAAFRLPLLAFIAVLSAAAMVMVMVVIVFSFDDRDHGCFAIKHLRAMAR